ncbi:MAG: hypothetical protein LAO21_03405 [Acidobacteriia bacterium]|nr:hypothetical protein [Terriglobia bacterium]
MSNDYMYVDPKVQKIRNLYADVFTGGFYSLPVRRQLELQADRLTEAHHNRDDSVCFQIGSWHPDWVGKPDEWILNHVFSIDDGRTTIAREYGFKDWNDVDSIANRRSNVQFEKAVNTMLSGNLSLLKGLIGETPELTRERSQYGHSATLLHYAGTNGVESYRQVVPWNLAEIVDFLIASGADLTSRANIYGGSSPRELFETSKHSYASNVHKDVITLFKKYEARLGR